MDQIYSPAWKPPKERKRQNLTRVSKAMDIRQWSKMTPGTWKTRKGKPTLAAVYSFGRGSRLLCGGDRAQPYRFPELRWSWGSKKSKMVSVHGPEYQRRKTCTKRELWRYTEGPLKFPAEYWLAHACEENTTVRGKNYLKGTNYQSSLKKN